MTERLRTPTRENEGQSTHYQTNSDRKTFTRNKKFKGRKQHRTKYLLANE